MARQSSEQKQVVGRVMHAFKQGQLDQPNGEPVENPKPTPRRWERNAGLSKAELLAEARRRKIPGRSRMTKADLEKALG